MSDDELRFSGLPWRWRIVALVMFFGIMALWGVIVTNVVAWLPQSVLGYVLVAMMAWSVGAIMGERSARKEIKKRWGRDPLA